jgi:photosystem II stability/assembly factor-like uncharacterized protein
MKGWMALAAVAALGALAHGADYLSVGMKGADGAERLSSLLAGKGKIVRFDKVSYTYTVELAKGQSAKAVVGQLLKSKGVVTARASQPNLSWEDADFTSVPSLKAVLDELNLRNADARAARAANGLPQPKKWETYKTGYYEGYKFWLEERAYPGKTFDGSIYAPAAAHRDRMEPFHGYVSATGQLRYNTGPFEFIGPTNLDVPYNTYYGVRPTSGRVGAWAIDPTNPNRMYLGGANGGIWKSTDGGVNWVPLTDNWTFLTVSSIAIDPSDPQTIYVGTGDFHGSRNQQMGIMKSTDGGNTWSQLGAAQFGGRAVSDILIDPENTQIVTISTGRGGSGNAFVWRSTNGGNTWTSVINSSQNWATLSMGANNAGTRYYYASAGGTGGNVWRSADRGATWTKLTTPAAAATNHSVIMVEASPVFPNTVYIVVNADRKVYKSIDAGATWSDVTGNLPSTGNSYFWSQSTYNFFLTVSFRPGPQDVLYVGFIDVEMSADGGTTWRTIGAPTYVGGSAVTHNDQHVCVVDPTDPNRVFIGNDGGAYRYTYNPTTNTGTWGYLSRFLGISMFYKAAIHPTNAAHVMGGTQDNATPHSLGNLNTWDNVGGGDGGFCAINPLNANIQYATSQSLGIYRTTNAWSSSNGISPNTNDPRAFIAPITLDPNAPNLLYAGTNYLNVRNETTGTWTLRIGNQALTTGTLRFIAVAPGDSNTIYTSGSDGQVWATFNAGTNWKRIDSGTVSLPTRTVNYISINPANKHDILVSLSGSGSGHIYRCADTSAVSVTWQNMNGTGTASLPNVPFNTIQRDPVDFDNTWFAGSDIGMFVTEDAGATWQNATQPIGLPNVQVNDILCNADTGYLYAATYGRGMWRLPLPQVVYPSAATVISGTANPSNALSQLRRSDNARYQVLSTRFSSIAAVEFTGASPSATLTELQFVFEGLSTRPQLVLSVDLFNQTTGQWEPVSSRPANSTEERFIVKITSNPSRFVNSATNQMRARLRWIPTADLRGFDGWTNSVDRAFWRVIP